MFLSLTGWADEGKKNSLQSLTTQANKPVHSSNSSLNKKSSGAFRLGIIEVKHEVIICGRVSFSSLLRLDECEFCALIAFCVQIQSVSKMKFLLLFIAATFWLSDPGSAVELTFELPDNAKECFYEVIQKDTEATVEFQVRNHAEKLRHKLQ